MINFELKYEKTIKQFLERIDFAPDIAIVLGSGLGEFASHLEVINSFETKELAGYPSSTVEGHKGKIIIGLYGGKKVLLFQGRIHFYEGYQLSECLLPIYLVVKSGCKNLLLTNAAGGVNDYFKPGDLMLVNSFNYMSLYKEVAEVLGIGSVDQRNMFLDFPSKVINNKIRMGALNGKVTLKEGSYWFSKGPSYETPAEIKMFKKFGCDAIGMSTVHEAIFGAFLGLKVGAISCITNFAAGLSDTKLSHKEVMETGLIAKESFENLVKSTIEGL
ncbi:MAG: purine-nucleoside phosphorylase [Melioribacteraceae bacterium]|nr:purine-nucleoside phosphorylase [Melioribacteraceae bacterium]